MNLDAWQAADTTASVLAAVLLAVPLIARLAGRVHARLYPTTPPALLAMTLLALLGGISTNAAAAWAVAGVGVGALAGLAIGQRDRDD